MVQIKINHAKSFLPLSTSTGSAVQRMQKARLFNLKFYDNLQECIRNNEIAPRTFIKALRDTMGANIGIDIAPVNSKEEAYMAYCLNAKGVCNGYMLGLPKAFYTEKIHKNSAPTFLNETQNMFNEIFNPKILQRFKILVNKFYNIKSILQFYKENVSGTATLTPEALENFLKNKRYQEQIDLLQFMRYKLLSEQNTAQAKYQIDKRIECHNNFKYERKENYYDLDKYQFGTKLGLIQNKLAEAIKLERGIG